MLSVCVFASSASGLAESFHNAAVELGKGIALRGWTMVYGGGGSGLMGSCAGAAVKAGGHVVGFAPNWLQSSELRGDGNTVLHEVESMSERKAAMVGCSDAFIALPGGLGTLDETTEVLTLQYLKRLNGPTILVDVDGFWGPFVALLGHLADTGMMTKQTAESVVVADVETTLQMVGAVEGWQH